MGCVALVLWFLRESEPSVTGTVRLNGEALATGSIAWIPIEGTPGPGGGGGISGEGKYEIKRGLRPGKYYLRAASIGFGPRNVAFSITDSVPRAALDPISLTRISVTLQSVQVQGEKPAVVIEPDRNTYRAKEIAPADKRIYALNVSEMPEFKEKYVKPFDDNVRYAAEIISSLEVPTATDPDTGEVTAARKADFNNDFVPIYQMASKSLTEARKMAKATFGEDAQTGLKHVQELQRLVTSNSKSFKTQPTMSGRKNNPASNRRKISSQKLGAITTPILQRRTLSIFSLIQRTKNALKSGTRQFRWLTPGTTTRR